MCRSRWPDSMALPFTSAEYVGRRYTLSHRMRVNGVCCIKTATLIMKVKVRYEASLQAGRAALHWLGTVASGAKSWLSTVSQSEHVFQLFSSNIHMIVGLWTHEYLHLVSLSLCYGTRSRTEPSSNSSSSGMLLSTARHSIVVADYRERDH